MSIFTKDISLKDKENKIKELIRHNDRVAKNVFDSIYNYFSFGQKFQKSNHLIVFNAIYVNNINGPAWKVANYCNMSRTTLFNYRNNIIKYFEICLKENFVLDKLD